MLEVRGRRFTLKQFFNEHVFIEHITPIAVTGEKFNQIKKLHCVLIQDKKKTFKNHYFKKNYYCRKRIEVYFSVHWNSHARMHFYGVLESQLREFS